MKGYYRHILLASAVLLAAAGCVKTHIGETPSEPMPISISAVEGTATKALLDNGTFNTTGNKIKIYDYVTSDGTVTKHIDDHITPYNAGTTNTPNHPDFDPALHWPFVTQNHQWTPGTHKFFGWLAEDANMTSTTDAAANTPDEFFGSGFSFNETSHILTIPQKAMTIDTPQFDFMYSNIHTRDMDTTPDYSPVPLSFSHLFSAFCITGLNRDDSATITVKRIEINGLNNTKSAQIDFKGNQPEVTYTDASTTSSMFEFNYTGTVLETNAISLSDKYLIWPQTTADFADATLTIVYDFTSDGDTSENTSPAIPLSSIPEWEAGVVNTINIEFDVDQITFYIRTLQAWNTEEQDIPVQM